LLPHLLEFRGALYEVQDLVESGECQSRDRIGPTVVNGDAASWLII
jgi:hypothetical protein